MAVPTHVTTKDLSGTYILNTKLSDSSEPILKMQGVSWMIRKAVANSTITVTIKHFTDKDGKSHIDQAQTSSFKITNSDDRVLDGEPHERDNFIWGKVKSTNRFVRLADIQDSYLKEGWTQDAAGVELIEAVNESLSDTWTATQIFGFADVDGARRQVRKVVGRKGTQVEHMRQIYDWKA